MTTNLNRDRKALAQVLRDLADALERQPEHVALAIKDIRKVADEVDGRKER